MITKGEVRGSMRGCPKAVKDIPAAERNEWAALAVADKLGVSVWSVRKQWFEVIQDKVFCVDGRDYIGWTERGPGASTVWLWYVKESPHNPATVKPDADEPY